MHLLNSNGDCCHGTVLCPAVVLVKQLGNDQFSLIRAAPERLGGAWCVVFLYQCLHRVPECSFIYGGYSNHRLCDFLKCALHSVFSNRLPFHFHVLSFHFFHGDIHPELSGYFVQVAFFNGHRGAASWAEGQPSEFTHDFFHCAISSHPALPAPVQS